MSTVLLAQISRANQAPGSSPGDFFKARAHCEMACINRPSSFPAPQGFFVGPNQYLPSRKLKIEVLQNYLKVAAQILPKNEAHSKSVLWHTDLHGGNIFVDPAEPTKIVNIIDWQGVNISPCFIQACHPALINLQDHVPEDLMTPVHLPDGLDEMPKDEQERVKNLFGAQAIYQVYEIDLIRECRDAGLALQFKNTLPAHITSAARTIFADGEPDLLGMLIRLQGNWHKIDPSLPCPLAFTPEDRQRHARLDARWQAGYDLLDDLWYEMGVEPDWDGWVTHGSYDMFKEREARCRGKFLQRLTTTEAARRQFLAVWPFADRPDRTENL